MKLLVVKTDAVLRSDVYKKVVADLDKCLSTGLLFLDGSADYEVVEFDSTRYGLKLKED